MKLNLGCGEHHADGWVNVDGFEGSRADVITDIRTLPFTDGSASHIYAGHVLEHVHPDALPDVLREIRRVLAPDGQLCIVGPDCDRIDRDKDSALYAMAAEGHDGLGINPYAPHLWSCTEALILAYLGECFPDATPIPVADVPECWPVVCRTEAWQCAILA